MSYDPSTHTEVYQIVDGGIQAHPVVTATAEKLCAEKAPISPEASAVDQQSRSPQEQGSVFCLDRQELKDKGCAVHSGSGKTFYLRRADAVGKA